MPPTAVKAENVPLCVDLKGTVIKTDLLWESVILLVKQHPWAVLALPFWLLRGRAHLQRQIALKIRFNAACLPYRREALEWLRAERASGRPVVLASSSDESLARAVARHVDLFDQVLGANATLEITPWNDAFAAGAPVAPKPWNAWRRALRVHQWSKNLLILVPVITSHRILDLTALLRSGLMFAAFCCCASALYIVNDLLDVSSDRLHPEKCRRPFACGQLPLLAGIVAAPILLAAAFAVALPLGRIPEAVLLCYACVSLSYSLRLKSHAPLDVFLLSGLYTVRIVAGGVATNIWLSGWLLSFSVFLFLSLAFTKRLAELRLLRDLKQEQTNGRGYLAGDLEIVSAFAVCSGFISSLVLAFYVNSDQVRILYRQPLYLWLLFPLLLYWLTKLWMVAFRGQLHEDPVSYAIKSFSTYAVGFISLLLLVTAKFDLLARWLH